MFEERKFIISIEMNEDLSEYVLVGKCDGKVIKKRVEYSFGDSLIELYDFQREIYDEYNVDTRFDSFEVKVNIYC